MAIRRIGNSNAGLTLIASATVTSNISSLEFTNIPSSYQNLFLTWVGITQDLQTSQYWAIGFNSDTTNAYFYRHFASGTSSTAVTGSGATGSTIGTSGSAAPIMAARNSSGTGYMWIYRYNDSGLKQWTYTSVGLSLGQTNNERIALGQGTYSGAKVQSIQFIRNSSQVITSGSFYLYGNL